MYFAGTLYWVVGTMHTYGGLAIPIAVIACVLLVVFLALYVGLFAWSVGRALRWLGPSALWLAPLLWTAAEYLRSWVFGGFPWVLLGYSQAMVLPVAQAASIGGVYLLSALVALVSVAAAWVVTERRQTRWLASGAAVAGVLAIALWGAARVRDGALTRSGEVVRVGLVQGNIAQEDKWNPVLAESILDRYLDMSRRAIADGAQAVIWPESSTPFFLEEDPVRASRIRRLAAETGTPFVIGSDQYERDPQRFYNAAFLVGPDGATAAVYRKMHLVPFGEYVPFRTLLPFVAPLVEAVAEFSPGLEPVLLPVGDRHLSVAICYEVVYPWLVRSFVLGGSDLLVTITNDAWYGTTSAAYQHWEQASLRAIEHGRYLVRAANTGISGIVDPYGRIVTRTELFETDVVVGEVRWISERTIYATIGDVIAWLSLAVLLMVVIASRATKRAS